MSRQKVIHKKGNSHLHGVAGFTTPLHTLQGTNISPQKWHVEDDFPFPKVGYVNSLEGIQNVVVLKTIYFSVPTGKDGSKLTNKFFSWVEMHP